jgi:RNA polymerase sigma-70 factor, ECF subfamily
MPEEFQYNDEAALIRAVINGDLNASRVLVNNYCRRAYNIALNDFELDMATADDIFQDLCIHLISNEFRVLRQWRGDSPLSAYFRTIIRNLILGRLRKEPRQIDPPDPPGADPDPEPGTIDDGLAECIRNALDHLKDRDRELITLRHWKDFSYAEIASIIGITINNVGVALLRAEQRLAKLVTSRCRGWL